MKWIKILLIVGIISMMTGCGKSYHELEYEEVLSKMEAKETFVLYVGSATCTACADFTPKLKRAINNYDLEVYYIDVDQLSESEINHFMTVINFGGYTPKVYFIENGAYSQYEAIDGDLDYDVIVAKFKAKGYIGD